MIEEQIDQLNRMGDMLESGKENLGKFTDVAFDIFKPLKRVFRRFRPNKMLDFFENSVKASEKSIDFYEGLAGLGKYMDDMQTKMEDLGENENVVEQLEELQSLLDVDVREDMNLSLEGIDDPPKEVINELQDEIDGLVGQVNMFYEETIEGRFGDEFAENFEEFKEETSEWMEEINEKFGEVWDVEDAFDDFEDEREDQWDDMEDEVEEVSENMMEKFKGMFSGDYFDIAELLSLGEIRQQMGVDEEIASLEDARIAFQEAGIGSREDWSVYLSDMMGWFNDVNREAEYTLSYSEDLVQSMQEAAETDVSDKSVLSAMVKFATKNRTMLQGMDLENWLFIRDSITRFGEEGEKALQGIADVVGYLDNDVKLDFSADEGLENIEKLRPQLMGIADSAEEFEQLANSVSESTALLSHMRIDSAPIMEDIKSVMSGADIRDTDVLQRLVPILGMDRNTIQKRLKSGDISGVVVDFVEGMNSKFGDMSLENRSVIADLFNVEPDQVQDIINNISRVRDGVNRIGGSLEEASGYANEYNKEINPATLWQRFTGRVLNFDIIQRGIRLWSELGLTAEWAIVVMYGIGKLGKIAMTIFKNWSSVVGVFKTLGTKMSGVVLKAKGLSGVFSKIAGGSIITGLKSIGATIAGWGGSLLALMGPVGWIIAGIAAISVGSYLVVKYWDQISGFFDKILGPIDEFVGKVWDVVWGIMKAGYYLSDQILSEIPIINKGWALTKWVLSGIGNILKWIGEGVYYLGEFIVENIVESFKIVRDIVFGVGDSIGWVWSQVQSLWNMLKSFGNILTDIADSPRYAAFKAHYYIDKWFSDMWESIKKIPSKLLEIFSIDIDFDWEKFKANMKSKLAGVKKWFSDLFNIDFNWENFKTYFNQKIMELGNWMRQKFDNLLPDIDLPSIPKIKQAVMNKVNELQEWVETKKKQIQDLLPDINIPSIPDIKKYVVGKVNDLEVWVETKRQSIENVFPDINLPSIPDIKKSVKSKVNSVEIWMETKKQQFMDLIPDISLPNIPNIKQELNERYDGLIRWKNTKIEQFKNLIPDIELPSIPDIKEEIDKKWNNFNTWFEGKFDINLDSVWQGYLDGFKQKWKNFKIWFKGLFEVNLSDIWNNLLDTLETSITNLVNTVINKVNGAIDTINNIPYVDIEKIPELATGGIATEQTVSMLAENNKPEAIIPLDRLDSVLAGSQNVVQMSSYVDQKGESIEDSGKQSVVEVVNDNSDVVDVIEWQTRKVIEKIDEIYQDSKKERKKDKKDKPKRDKFIGLF